MSDSIFAITGAGFVMLVADTSATRSIMAYKHDEDKIRVLDSHKLLAIAGPQSDSTYFGEFVSKNVALYEYRTGLKLNTKSTAHYIRGSLATALRKGPYQCNLLLGGWDAPAPGGEGAASGAGGPSLYFMDYLGSSSKTNYGAHGYAGYFILSTMDRYWKPDMGLEEVKALARLCIKELGTRFMLHQPHFLAKVVSAEGVSVVDLAAAPPAV